MSEMNVRKAGRPAGKKNKTSFAVSCYFQTRDQNNPGFIKKINNFIMTSFQAFSSMDNYLV